MAAQQIDLYAPDVIIVCGTATLQSMNQDLGLDLSKPVRTVTRGGAVVDVHQWRGRRIVWAPHPAARIKPQEWVDAVRSFFVSPIKREWERAGSDMLVQLWERAAAR